jgi:hypothetical protein
MPVAAPPRLLPLKARDQVALVVESLPVLSATVVATTREEATLLLGPESQLPARMLHRRSAAIETAVEGRRYRGEGELAMTSGRRGRVRDDTVIFHFEKAGAPLVRRQHERSPAVLPVTVVPIRAQLPPARALTVDISAYGALVRAPGQIANGQELLLHLQLPNEELPIPASGEVVRRTPEGLVGVRLDKMRPADRDLVTAWIRGRSAGALGR